MTTLDLGPWDCSGQTAIPTRTTTTDTPTNRCHCGRSIWDPVSVARGIGPVCWARQHGASDAPAARAHDVSPAQLALIPDAATGPVPGDDYEI